MKFPILFEDNHVIVVNKPAGWIVQGATPDQESLLEEVRRYVKLKFQKPGNVFLGVVSRLDAPVTGVVPIARTSKGAARLSEQIRLRTVDKHYWALVSGKLPSDQGTLRHQLFRGDTETMTRVVERAGPNVQEGILHYQTMAGWGNGTWVQIQLETGRKHQIRAQFSAIGCPIIGDLKYGGERWRETGIALHCHAFACLHPTLKNKLQWVAAPPTSWRQYLHSQGANSIWNEMNQADRSNSE